MRVGQPGLLLSTLLLLTLILTVTTHVLAAQVKLAWDDPYNASADVAGYILYYWQPQWDIPASVDVGDQTAFTLIGLEAGHTYVFAVTAYDVAGYESDYSNVVRTTLPPSQPTDAADAGLTDADEAMVVAEPNLPATDGGRINDGDEPASVNPQPSTLFAISTPKEGDMLAGNAVSVAVSDVPSGTSTVLFQVLPVDVEAPELLGETAAEPFSVVWDTSAHKDGDYVLSAIAISSEDKPIMTATSIVTVNNTMSDEADIIEDNGFKYVVMEGDREQVVVTSDGVIVEIPAGIFAADDKIVIRAVDAIDVPGKLPGDAAGIIVDITAESGQHRFDTDITIRLPYVDDDQDGLIDGTTIAETTLTIWFFDGADWRQLFHTEVHPNDNVIAGWTDHFTEFGVFSISAETGSSDSTTLPTTQSQNQGGGGSGGSCFIATAAFGSPWESQVHVLREFRDAYLLTNRPGQWFVAQYYQLSPPIADFIAGHDSIRMIVRIGLTPLVWGGSFMLQSTRTQGLALTTIILLRCVSMAWMVWGLLPTNSGSAR